MYLNDPDFNIQQQNHLSIQAGDSGMRTVAIWTALHSPNLPHVVGEDFHNMCLDLLSVANENQAAQFYSCGHFVQHQDTWMINYLHFDDLGMFEQNEHLRTELNQKIIERLQTITDHFNACLLFQILRPEIFEDLLGRTIENFSDFVIFYDLYVNYLSSREQVITNAKASRGKNYKPFSPYDPTRKKPATTKSEKKSTIKKSPEYLIEEEKFALRLNHLEFELKNARDLRDKNKKDWADYLIDIRDRKKELTAEKRKVLGALKK